jgi:peptidoglycan/LPS O-acetylase OafA/YrhL
MEQPPQMPSHRWSIGDSMNMMSFIAFTLGSFWSLTVRRYGTVGTRFYPIYVFYCMMVMAVLLAGSHPASIDRVVFTFALPYFLLNFLFHLISTQRSRAKGNHVHSWHVGISRYGKGLELVFGLLVAGGLYLIAPISGVFLCVSVISSAMTGAMLEGRDKLRAVQMMDAELEQKRMVEIYERARGRVQ